MTIESEFRSVIACDKRKAFAQGSTCDEAIQLWCSKLEARKLDCFATLAMTLMQSAVIHRSRADTNQVPFVPRCVSQRTAAPERGCRRAAIGQNGSM
jgi:hypothetical protein